MHNLPFELRILGHTEFSGPDPEGTEAVVRQTKRLAILAYLAVATADGFRRRDQITAFFWPELDQVQARTALRKSLYGIREALGRDIFTTRGEDELRLDSGQVWCDAVALGQCVREGRWSDALSLYRGELLEGMFPEGVAQEFQEWLSVQRTALRRQAAQAAWECSRLEEERGDRTAAAVMARHARELDPDNEEGVRRLMELLDRRGDRGGALRVYSEWQARLAEEFGVEPDPETRKLARRVQAARKGESNETMLAPAPTMARSGDSVVGPSIELTVPAVLPSQPQSRWPRLWYVGLAVLATLVIGASVVSMSLPGRSVEPNSIAVLSIAAIGDSTLRGAAESLSEEMTTALAGDTSLVVRSVARTPDSSRSDVVRTGRELVAAYVIHGGVQRGEGTLRVTLRLVSTRNAVAVWSMSLDVDTAHARLLGQHVTADAAPAISSFIAKAQSTRTKGSR